MLDLHFEICDEDGNRDDAYLDELVNVFTQSPEGQTLANANADASCGQWVYLFLDFYLDYIGTCVAEISLAAVREVVFDLFPRKLSVAPKKGREIVRELRTFWAFLGREFALQQAANIQG